MKKRFLHLSVYFLLVGCGQPSTKTSVATDSAFHFLDSAQAKLDIAAASEEIQSRFTHEEILQELINRKQIRLFSHNYSKFKISLKRKSSRDSFPDLKKEMFRIHQPNPVLELYPTTALHDAFINTRKQIETLYNPDGSDKNRLEYDDPSALPYLKYADQVMGIVDRERLKTANNIAHLSSKGILHDFIKTINDGVPLCTVEKYSNQAVVMTGTAFPIDSYTIITAAHCIDQDRVCTPKILKDLLDNCSFVFGYQSNGGVISTSISPGNIYEGVGIINRPLGLDMAIIRLDKKIPDALIPKISDVLPLSTDSLFMVGYPIGVAKKITRGGCMRDANYNKDSVYFYSKIDAFKGNSGSPVYDQVNCQIIGLLISGGQDYTAEDLKENCCYYYSCKIVTAGNPGADSVCHGEKMINLIRVIPNILKLVKSSGSFGIVNN